MKTKRLLFLVMAICLASGVKAQFYDSAEDICYYVQEYHEYDESKEIMYNGMLTLRWEKTGKRIKDKIDENKAIVYIFNFDGKNAAELTGYYSGVNINEVKESLKRNPSYYEEKEETTDYNWKYVSSSSAGTVYRHPSSYNSSTYTFSTDRNKMIIDSGNNDIMTYKRVDKSFFKVGRSRTPSGTLHE